MTREWGNSAPYRERVGTSRKFFDELFGELSSVFEVSTYCRILRRCMRQLQMTRSRQSLHRTRWCRRYRDNDASGDERQEGARGCWERWQLLTTRRNLFRNGATMSASQLRTLKRMLSAWVKISFSKGDLKPANKEIYLRIHKSNGSKKSQSMQDTNQQYTELQHTFGWVIKCPQPTTRFTASIVFA